MQLSAKPPIEQCVYPESEFLSFTRCDGTVHFYTRVRALLADDSVVLDIGCGRGCAASDNCEYRRNSRDLRACNRRVVGIDVDLEAQSNPTVNEFRLINDTRKWPISDETIDVALCDYVLEHVTDPEPFFAEWSRVLKPGGYACFRTPNSLGYVALVASIVPNRFHARVAARAHRGKEAQDVFPTFYRCNRPRKIRSLFRKYGFHSCVYAIESEPNYLRFSRLAYRVGAAVHSILPSALRSTLIGFAKKT